MARGTPNTAPESASVQLDEAGRALARRTCPGCDRVFVHAGTKQTHLLAKHPHYEDPATPGDPTTRTSQRYDNVNARKAWICADAHGQVLPTIIFRGSVGPKSKLLWSAELAVYQVSTGHSCGVSAQRVNQRGFLPRRHPQRGTGPAECWD